MSPQGEASRLNETNTMNGLSAVSRPTTHGVSPPGHASRLATCQPQPAHFLPDAYEKKMTLPPLRSQTGGHVLEHGHHPGDSEQDATHKWGAVQEVFK